MKQFLALLLFTIFFTALILHNADQIDSATVNPVYDLPDKVVMFEPESKVMVFEATAYCYTGHKTATGTIPEEGRTVAADPNILPYGTEISINGRSGYIVEDCGGAIKGNRLDIYMNSRGQALYWGRQTVEVEVVE
jgi:3D (Asp-Asp-Asp) domain-containing protein